MKKKKWPMIVAAIIVIIVIAAVAGGKDDEPKKVSSDGQVQETGKTESTETQSQKFAVGDTAELKSVKVTLVSVTESEGSMFTKPADGNVLVGCEFEISNESDKDIDVSSVMSFEAYCDSYSAVQGNFTTKESKDEDKDSGSEAYPDEVLKVLRGLKDGEVADNIIETDTGYYVVRLDKINDEDATASKRESLQNSKESTYFTDTTAKWLDGADVKVVKKVIKTLKITDKHTFMAPTPTPVPETPTPEVTEEATPTPETEEVTETPAAEDTDVTETPAAEEEAETTETPEATPTEAAK